VIIAGGFEGKRVLDSIDIFDPEQGVFSGGRLSSPHANFTATTLARWESINPTSTLFCTISGKSSPSLFL